MKVGLLPYFRGHEQLNQNQRSQQNPSPQSLLAKGQMTDMFVSGNKANTTELTIIDKLLGEINKQVESIANKGTFYPPKGSH